MTLRRLLMQVGWTLAFPGVAQGTLGRWAWTAAFAAAGLVAAALVTWTVWALYAAIGVRVASALEAWPRLRKFGDDDENRRLPIYASLAGVLGIVWFFIVAERYEIPGSSMMPTIAIGDTVYINRLATSPERGEVIVFTHPCERRAHIKRVAALAGDTIEVRCSKLYVNGTLVPIELVDRACTYVDGNVTRECSRHRETIDGHTFDTYQLRDAGASSKDFPSLDRIVRSCHSAKLPAGEIVATKPGALPCEPQLHYVVPEGSVFVLGDNRANSNDSRYWGVVPAGNVTGTAIGVAWPPSHAGAID